MTVKVADNGDRPAGADEHRVFTPHLAQCPGGGLDVGIVHRNQARVAEVNQASKLTTPGSLVVSLATGKSALIGFESTLGDKRQVLLVNSNPKKSISVTPSWFKGSSDLRVESYSSSTAGSGNPLAQTTAASGRPVVLPALSVVVISGSPSS